LDVSSNWLGPDGVALLAESVASLTSLNISSNRLVRGAREEAFDGHAVAMVVSKAVDSVIGSKVGAAVDSYFGDSAYKTDLQGINALMAVLASTSLRKLSMSKNGIPMEAQAQLKASCEPHHITLECKGRTVIKEKYPKQNFSQGAWDCF
jgi:hypothetical protein